MNRDEVAALLAQFAPHATATAAIQAASARELVSRLAPLARPGATAVAADHAMYFNVLGAAGLVAPPLALEREALRGSVALAVRRCARASPAERAAASNLVAAILAEGDAPWAFPLVEALIAAADGDAASDATPPLTPALSRALFARPPRLASGGARATTAPPVYDRLRPLSRAQLWRHTPLLLERDTLRLVKLLLERPFIAPRAALRHVRWPLRCCERRGAGSGVAATAEDVALTRAVALYAASPALQRGAAAVLHELLAPGTPRATARAARGALALLHSALRASLPPDAPCRRAPVAYEPAWQRSPLLFPVLAAALEAQRAWRRLLDDGGGGGGGGDDDRSAADWSSLCGAVRTIHTTVRALVDARGGTESAVAAAPPAATAAAADGSALLLWATLQQYPALSEACCAVALRGPAAEDVVAGAELAAWLPCAHFGAAPSLTTAATDLRNALGATGAGKLSVLVDSERFVALLALSAKQQQRAVAIEAGNASASAGATASSSAVAASEEDEAVAIDAFPTACTAQQLLLVLTRVCPFAKMALVVRPLCAGLSQLASKLQRPHESAPGMLRTLLWVEAWVGAGGGGSGGGGGDDSSGARPLLRDEREQRVLDEMVLHVRARTEWCASVVVDERAMADLHARTRALGVIGSGK